ncbi:MAG: hypothetical protein JJW01_01245 [Alphaproteobacteria bacterium]|nr:hypothetical protein [Rickettsiales bacterium]
MTKEFIKDINPNDEPYLLGLHHNLIVEYGLFKTGTVGVDIFSSLYGTANNILMKETTIGIPITELYYKQKIFNYKGVVFTIEPRLKAPAIYKKNELGNMLFNYQSQSDFQIQASLGFSLHDSQVGIPGVTQSEGAFFYISAAYRNRLLLPFDEIRIEAGIGVHLSDISIILQFRKIFHLYTQSGMDTEITSYHIGIFTINVATHITKNTSLVVGLVFDAGSNVNLLPQSGYQRGSGIIFGIWQNL